MAHTDDTRQPDRRDFIVHAAFAFAGVGCAAATWPLIDQMNPHIGTPPPETRDVDLRTIRPGQTVSVPWRGKPVFVRHRTPQEVQLARDTPVSDLADPLARNELLPVKATATDANRTKPGHESWLVVVGICTHLGCLLTAQDPVAAASNEGWFCRCHAARFDLSGRVRGGPARTNLPVPPYQFLSPGKIRIG
jgi:ubiquinol-cytochrome c reductase iron-sulfur subunit